MGMELLRRARKSDESALERVPTFMAQTSPTREGAGRWARRSGATGRLARLWQGARDCTAVLVRLGYNGDAIVVR